MEKSIIFDGRLLLSLFVVANEDEGDDDDSQRCHGCWRRILLEADIGFSNRRECRIVLRVAARTAAFMA